MTSAGQNITRNQLELSTGLLADHAFISPKYFYNVIGSVLFEAICVLPEYYPTTTETTIFNQFQHEIMQSIPRGSTLIDLGAGNCAKAARLFNFIHPDQYVPIDISSEHLTGAVRHLQQQFPHIEMMAVSRDFSVPWSLPNEVRQKQRLFFYPGSSIGNFQPEDALAFLKQLRIFCDEDSGILIGIDLIKDHSVLNSAYNDSLGVTSAFNLNILHHTNQLLGTNFDVHQWRHQAFFHVAQSRMEMHLEARTNLDVEWTVEQEHYHRHFHSGERLHTEYSYKYTLPSFLNLLERAGFKEACYWTDDKQWYAVVYAKGKA